MDLQEAQQIVEEGYLEVLRRRPESQRVKMNYSIQLVTKAKTKEQFLDELRTSQEYRDMMAREIGTDHLNKKDNIPGLGTPEINTKIVLVSTWGIRCGIATYTAHLLNNINKQHDNKNSVGIFPINDISVGYNLKNIELVHIQHEFGIMPKGLDIDKKVKVLITFHTVPKTIRQTLIELETKYNIVGYISHFNEAKKILSESTTREVHLIPHGSVVIPWAGDKTTKSFIRAELGFNKLGIKNGDMCAFLFGFQSGNKNYNRVIMACINTNIKLIISGGTHQCGYVDKSVKYTNNNIILLGKYLTDIEVDLYASACDLLLFDYKEQKQYSCSGAMHRVIGSGNPVICNRTNHFTDVNENVHCLKFFDQKELEAKIREALEKKEEFSERAIQYANETSWENVAKQHVEVYKKYVDLELDLEV